MKIVFIINDITRIGGVERVTVNTANLFVNELYYNIDIISVFSRKNTEPYYELDKSILTKYLMDPNNKYKGQLKKYIFIMRELKRILSKTKYDIIITSSVSLSLMTLIARYSSRVINSKIIAWEHSQYDNITNVFSVIRRISYKYLDAIITLSNHDKEILSKFNENTICIHNMNNFNSDDNVIPNLNSKKIIAVGRLEKEKGFDKLIEAYKEVNEKHPNWKLRIFGEGSERDFLQKLIKKYGLSGSVEINPFTSKIYERYKESSIFVLSSKTESFGMALLEAMTCGLSCVSFDCKAGPREIIDDGVDGLLIPPDNVFELASGINCLIEDEHLRCKLSQNAIIKSKKFSNKNILRKWKNLFETI